MQRARPGITLTAALTAGLATGLAAGLATALVVGSAAAQSAVAPATTTDLQPQKLQRGPDIAVPHIDAGDFVDGARRVELPGSVARVIGQAGDAWLVGTGNVDRKRNRRIVRVEADGTVTTILRDIDHVTAILSADGSTLAWQRVVSDGRKAVTYVASSADGAVLGQRGPASPATLLDVGADRVLFGGGTRTLQWRFATDRSRTVVSKRANFADIEHDLLGFYTRDPYSGGCTKVTRLSAPSTTVWRSCDDRVWDVSPDGTRLATVDLLSDGLGPGVVTIREIDGTAVSRYGTGWFDAIGWESPTTVLLGVNGAKRSATVRCTLSACENATDPEPTRSPRRGARG